MDKVSNYIQKHAKWANALSKLRAILNDTELVETIKWGAPTYTINDKNVAGIGAFKNHFGLWFFQGVFLEDKKKILINAQEGKTKALRQMKFTSIDDIDEQTIRVYLLESIENRKLGKEIKPERKKEFDIPVELQSTLSGSGKLQDAFDRLSPGKQKEYANHIAEAKREATKMNRVEKIIPMIKEGIGLYDKYKNC